MNRVSQAPEIRERIFRAACVLFARYGYRGTTTRDICERARVPLGSLHYHFGSKEALYSAVGESLLKQEGEIATELERELGNSGDTLNVRDRLGRLLDRWIDFLFDHSEIARIGLHRIAEYGTPEFPAVTPSVLPSGRSVAQLLSRTLGIPRTLNLRAQILAANDVVAGFIGGAAQHSRALGLDARSPAYRNLVKRTVFALFSHWVPEEADGS